MITSQKEYPSTWSRYSFIQVQLRFFLSLIAIALIIFSAKNVEVIPEFLLDAPEQVQDLFLRMWPIDFDYYPKGIHEALLDTIHIATLGTIISLAIAFPIGLCTSYRLIPFRIINLIAQFILVASRSINSIIWALLFVAIFGPGALAGTLAIAFRSIGFVGKLLGESIDTADMNSIEALKACGAPWLSIFTKGYWPQIAPSFWSIALFRWDINIRESSVLGLVGAGGIGMALDSALNLFQWTRVSLILLCIFIIVVIAEIIVTQIRKKLI
ncbi:phosphonate ABC transporter, permease protein PhnE [Polynucleobacter sp. IMCC30063]|uniref:phosphonate ABC transporter, permease protein PhnE n=1 Tax=Polynucleobacter sp. IMCC30063 TaxID=2907298 RepID=UPI001F3810E1|nr:phosphonate ABC transporter, permease protein PhnE [Polynucleobacter sp. IMCC30063]MCE7505471.1 phosphonate ABC transporter, permease protein PhnE [Polynucleobacter sp. IMCC30063]